MTTTEPALIPFEWREAIEAAPDDFTVRLALADWFQEQGLELAADCLRWTVEKGRTPSDRGWGEYGDKEAEVPRRVVTLCGLISSTRKYDWQAFDRLLRVWQLATDSERSEWWRWNP